MSSLPSSSASLLRDSTGHLVVGSCFRFWSRRLSAAWSYSLPAHAKRKVRPSIRMDHSPVCPTDFNATGASTPWCRAALSDSTQLATSLQLFRMQVKPARNCVYALPSALPKTKETKTPTKENRYSQSVLSALLFCSSHLPISDELMPLRVAPHGTIVHQTKTRGPESLKHSGKPSVRWHIFQRDADWRGAASQQGNARKEMQFRCIR